MRTMLPFVERGGAPTACTLLSVSGELPFLSRSLARVVPVGFIVRMVPTHPDPP